MEIVLDASAIIAVIADEPEAQTVINCTKNSAIVSPNIISCEIANALTRMMRKNIIKTKEQMLDGSTRCRYLILLNLLRIYQRYLTRH